MNKQYMETLKELEIKKAPEEQSIVAANDNYTKKQLAHFIKRHDLDIAKSWKKAEIVEALTEWMDSAQKEILEADSDLHSFYSNKIVNTEGAVNIYEDELSDEKVENVLKLVEHGLVYNADGQLWTPATEAAEVSTVENESTDQTEEAENETSQEQAAPKSQPKPTAQPASPSFFKEEDIEKKKEARLKYLKKQAKRKKKGKKRK